MGWLMGLDGNGKLDEELVGGFIYRQLLLYSRNCLFTALDIITGSYIAGAFQFPGLDTAAAACRRRPLFDPGSKTSQAKKNCPGARFCQIDTRRFFVGMHAAGG
jgi:hypothetical protein